MENRTINIAIVAEVASALKELKNKMVFVGGAVVSLYTDDPAADEIRPTADVDMTINLLNFAEWSQMQERLADLGFSPNPTGHAIINYLYNGILVDIMPSNDGPLGPANKWYKVGFNNLWTMNVENEEIKILSAPCFLATKFEAFKDRGADYRTSHDIEDIIYVIDNRLYIVEEIAKEDECIKAFLKLQLKSIVDKGLLSEVLMAHIHPLMLEERLPIVEEKITKILEN